MKKLTKIITMIIISLLSSLLTPIFGNWYQQTTGIDPIGFYIVSVLGAFAIWIYVVINYLID